mgnify:CR=1 FL=1
MASNMGHGKEDDSAVVKAVETIGDGWEKFVVIGLIKAVEATYDRRVS